LHRGTARYLPGVSFVDRVRESAARYASMTLAELFRGPTITVDPELAAEAADAEPSSLRVLREDLVAWLRRRNQFVVIDRTGEDELDAGIESLAVELADAEPEDVQDVVDEHVERFIDFVRERLGDEPKDVIAGEYSAALQLDVLGLRIASLDAPILDVGCGAKATLVRALRAAGLDATGIDNAALPPGTAEEIAITADWLTYDYGSAKWGSVISHLGFSLHFLHQHHASGEGARAYAETYLRIIRSLKPGGVFAYAPSLPFFEPVLPKEGLLVTRRRVAPTPTLTNLASTSGLSLAESTLVRRVG
jgi:hypothetical protein